VRRVVGMRGGFHGSILFLRVYLPHLRLCIFGGVCSQGTEDTIPRWWYSGNGDESGQLPATVRRCWCFEDRVEVSLVYAYMPYTAVSIMLLGAPGFLS